MFPTFIIPAPGTHFRSELFHPIRTFSRGYNICRGVGNSTPFRSDAKISKKNVIANINGVDHHWMMNLKLMNIFYRSSIVMVHFCIKLSKKRCNNDIHWITIVRFQIFHLYLCIFLSTFLLRLNWFFFFSKKKSHRVFVWIHEWIGQTHDYGKTICYKVMMLMTVTMLVSVCSAQYIQTTSERILYYTTFVCFFHLSFSFPSWLCVCVRARMCWCVWVLFLLVHTPL